MILYKVEKAERILSGMDVPDEKRIVTPSNAFWLLCNVSQRNIDHPDLVEIMTILRDIVYRNRVP